MIWTRVQSKVKFESDLSQIYRFKLPELRVGTLDSLLALSDDLVKVGQESCLHLNLREIALDAEILECRKTYRLLKTRFSALCIGLVQSHVQTEVQCVSEETPIKSQRGELKN